MAGLVHHYRQCGHTVEVSGGLVRGRIEIDGKCPACLEKAGKKQLAEEQRANGAAAAGDRP